jgi:transcriptional regulator with XRE-family HTH domain
MGRPSLDVVMAERAGAEVRRLRKVSRLSLSELAALARFDVSQLSKIERGKCGTDLPGWARLAGALGVGLDSIVRRRTKAGRAA